MTNLMNPGLTQFARRLRRNSSDVEQLLWSNLRNKNLRNLKFRRQQPIGKFIADFVCFEKRVVVELDGSQHAESEKDLLRDKWFSQQGFRVLRFWNNEVFENLDGVLEKIMEVCLSEYPPPNPSLEGGESEFQADLIIYF
ncbi:MAG: endonuclease domain-containing protein [Patescibacteria group bacterium]